MDPSAVARVALRRHRRGRCDLIGACFTKPITVLFDPVHTGDVPIDVVFHAKWHLLLTLNGTLTLSLLLHERP